MPEGQHRDSGKGVSDGLREAIEGAFAATGKTRGRAQELVDEVTRRGQEARQEVAKRGHGAREEVARRSQGARDLIEGLRLATREDVRDLERQVEELSRRVAELEAKANPEVEG